MILKVKIICILFIFSSYNFYSQTIAGPNNPASAVNMNCTFAYGAPANYTPPNNVFTSNNLYASATHCPCCDTNTGCLYASNFGFSIPAGAVITGIRVDIEKQAPLGSNVQDNGIRLSKGGLEVGNNYLNPASWPSVDSYITYGGCNDLWGTTWSPADINNPNFGVYFASIDYSCVTYNITSRIDHIRISVCYNIPLPVYDYKMIFKPQKNNILIQVFKNDNRSDNGKIRLSVLEPKGTEYVQLKEWYKNDMPAKDSVNFIPDASGIYFFKLSLISQDNEELSIITDKCNFKKDEFFKYLNDWNAIFLYEKTNLRRIKIFDLSGKKISEIDLMNESEKMLFIPHKLSGLYILEFEMVNGQSLISKIIAN